MSRRRLRLWPRSLAGRLVLLLVAALALAQWALILILGNQQDAVVENIVHGQALNQTVTLARLLGSFPASEGDRLASAFGSRESCAVLESGVPAARTMSPAEADLARLLSTMLHGVGAGAPQVTIERIDHDGRPCAEGSAVGPAGASHDAAGPPARGPGGAVRLGRPRNVAVSMQVPLADGRWLSVRSAIGVPGGWNRVATLSFLLSSLAVALVAIVAIRLQTRSLRSLADASERFGRGETVPRLPEAGPAEVVVATHAFNTMQERLSQFMRDRLRLLASISHDLRTPITTLRLKAEFIDDEAVRDDIVATLDELTVICEATLAFTRAEATTEATATVPLDQLVADVADEFRLADAEVMTTALPEIAYACRPVALKRALRNLVENAVRYGDRARISLAQAGGAVVIVVEDDGPGLPPDQVEEAFQPFVRLEPSRSVETGGIGLGLAIARSIVRAHGGTLTLENRPEGGLRAEIRLPIQSA